MEARVLAQDATLDGDELARALHALGPQAVLVTGGHREEATDVLFDGDTTTPIPGPRHADGAAHGSGCTHSSSLAAHLAHGWPLADAARAARAMAAEAVRKGLRSVGRGVGPVDVLGVLDRAPKALMSR
jgi:hydroxymethylpyrimidine/phosphomethylpyrimidine kinase